MIIIEQNAEIIYQKYAKDLFEYYLNKNIITKHLNRVQLNTIALSTANGGANLLVN